MLGALADLVALSHLAFVLFVVGGGLLVLRWPRLAFLHLPAAAWGALVELMGWICPLTPLEFELRRRAGEGEYGGEFLARYLEWVLYPPGLTREVQLLLGALVVLINVAVYAWILRRRATRKT